MAQQEILREYLLAVGFKVDQPGERNVNRVLGVIDKGAKGLAGSLLGIGAAAVAMTAQFSSKMEKLYYASQRSRETAGNLQAIAFGAKQVGLGGEQMIAAVEGMQRAIRLNPGLQGLLQQLGVDISRGPAEQLKDLVKVLSKMDPYIGAQYGQLFGLDPDTLLQLGNNITQLEEAERKRKEFAQGLGMDAEAMAKAGKEFSAELGEIHEKFAMLKDVIAYSLLGPMREVSGVVKEATADWIKLVKEVDKYGAKSTKDRLLEGLGLKPVGGGVKLAPGVETPPQEKKSWWQEQVSKAWDPNRKRAPWIPSFLLPQGGKTAPGAVPGPSAGALALPNTLGFRNRNPGNMRNWDNEPKNKGFSVFPSLERGLSAMAGQLLKYSKQGIKSVREIAEKWAPRNENDTDSYITNLAKMAGVHPDQQLNLKDPEMLRRIMMGIITNENGRNPIPMSMLDQAISTRLGSPQVSLQQTTNIHIHGAESPRAAGQETAAQQERVNGDLVRNFRGALR